MVFAKNEDGEILPQSRRAQRNATIAKGYVEANKNWQAYSDDLEVLKELNKQLDNNGQAITDNEQRMAKANEVTKNASQRAKDYGKQMATNTKTLTDFKRENEVEKPDQQKQGKWSDGLKSMASAGLSMIGNAFISAGVGMLVQGAFSLLGKGIDAFVHKNENLIAKGQEAKESIQSQTKAYEDQKASLGELTSKYTELSKGVKISGNSIKNISLTDDEYKDFLDTSNQIAAAAPSLTRSWDSQGNAILNAGTNAEDLNTQVNDYLKLQRNLTYYDTKKNISDQYKGYETALGTNKGKRDEYKNAYDAAKYKVDSVQKFSDMLKKHTKGEDTITYTLDQTAYDALGNTFGKAIKGYKQSADGQKITLEFDGKQLDFLNSEAASVLNSDNSELQEAHTNLVNTQESIDASKREMVSSIKSMASTIDSFDSWDDQDKASEFQSQLNSMLSSSDGTRLLDNFEQSGKDMDTWLRNNVVNPMAKGLEALYVDDEKNFDLEALKKSHDWPLYESIMNYTLPSIVAALQAQDETVEGFGKGNIISCVNPIVLGQDWYMVNPGTSSFQTIQIDDAPAYGITRGVKVTGTNGGIYQHNISIEPSGGTDITLSFNYDGSGNSSANIGFYSSSASVGDKNNYPFHRFAKLDTIAASYSDKSTTFFISQDYSGGGFGIVRIVLRTNNSSLASTVEVKWLVRCGLSADSVQVGIYNVFGKTYADAFFKTGGSYAGTCFRTLASGARGGISRTWVLVNSSEVSGTSATDAKTSTECYATIAAAGTALHKQAYSSIVSGTDSGTASYANSAGSANSVAWGNVTGKPSTFAPSSHTHNYAGSSSAGGAATSANKLSTPRKIGNASFDGTADITLSQMGLNVPVEITKANYLAKKKAGTLNANTYYNVIDEYDSANVINDSSVTANSAFSSTKSEKTYAKKSTLVNTTLTASKWTGSSAPYSYVLSVSGVTSSNIVEIDYASNASSAAIEAYQNAMLADGGQTTNQITIKATEKPTVDIPITIVIRNDL